MTVARLRDSKRGPAPYSPLVTARPAPNPHQQAEPDLLLLGALQGVFEFLQVFCNQVRSRNLCRPQFDLGQQSANGRYRNTVGAMADGRGQPASAGCKVPVRIPGSTRFTSAHFRTGSLSTRSNN